MTFIHQDTCQLLREPFHNSEQNINSESAINWQLTKNFHYGIFQWWMHDDDDDDDDEQQAYHWGN
jgi:hypothetical protein